MKLLINFIIIALTCLLISMNSYSQDNTLRVMTWNIRLDTPDDGVNHWDNRKAGVVAEVLKQNIDVLGVQEALGNQVKDFNRTLKGYKGLGVGRDDGKDKGEYNSIYYKKANLKVVRWGVFWLSETPDIAGSRGWDAACNRLCTWIEFKHKKSGEHFMVFNTHFDHMGDSARNESALLIINKINQLSNRLPLILMGDFNVNNNTRPYRIITFPENEYVLTNTRIRSKEKSGPDFSWVTFNPDYKDTDLIDFIFASEHFEVLKHTITDFRSTGKFLSDHLPVTATLKLAK